MNLKLKAFKPTKDNWYPSYKMDNGKEFVEVSCITLSDGKTRVCVWGADDDGREKDFDDPETAKNMFTILLALDSIEKDDLEQFGFIRA